VRDSRIAAIGAVGSIQLPAGTRTIDVSGKTIVPGFIDIHAHYSVAPGMTGIDVFPSQNTELLAPLAYGITTWRDPSARSQTIFSLAEMVEAGTALGPRIFSSGDIFFVQEWACCGQARSLDDAREMVRRQKALGATSIKEHTDPRRAQVQWVVQAAREESLMVATDPVRGHRGELRTIFDGVTSLEHLYAVTPIKKDAIELWAQSGAFYAPTLVIFGLEDYYQTQLANGHEDARVRRFIPHMKLDRDIHNYARWRMPAELALTRQAESIRDLLRGGVKVGLGSHGQVQGIGAHWEIWGMARAVTPLEALRMATMNGAEALGYQDDLGSLERGKLADLIVLSKNPLDDITNTTSIAYVMKGGVLWNGETMDEVWPRAKVRPKGAWEVDRR
jgi:imidazolonepropionase-like amidohydrolase